MLTVTMAVVVVVPVRILVGMRVPVVVTMLGFVVRMIVGGGALAVVAHDALLILSG